MENNIFKKVNQQVQENLKEQANETNEEWYARGVEENKRFFDWLEDK